MSKIYPIPNTEFNVIRESIECPHCDAIIVPELYHALVVRSHGNRHIVAFANCIESSCEQPFLIEFKQKYNPKDGDWEKKPFRQLDIYNYDYASNIPETLESLRDDEKRPYLKRFFEIYEHAHQANEHGLSEVSGPGFRKAFEFLIKDYAMVSFHEQKADIPTKPLLQVINLFAANEPLKVIATRATWLGNDQTHYHIKWTTKNIDDLTRLIESTLYWIVQTETLAELLISMPEEKKAKK